MKIISILLPLLFLVGCSASPPMETQTPSIITKIPEKTITQVVVNKSDIGVVTLTNNIIMDNKKINIGSKLYLTGLSLSVKYENPNLVGSILPHIIKFVDPESGSNITIENYSDIDALTAERKKIKTGSYKGCYYIDTEDDLKVFRNFSNNKQIITLSMYKKDGTKPKNYKATFDKLMIDVLDLSNNIFSNGKDEDITKFIDIYDKGVPIISTSMNLFESLESIKIGFSNQVSTYTTYGFPIRISVNELNEYNVDPNLVLTELGPYENFKAYQLTNGTVCYIINKFDKYSFLGNIYYEGVSMEVDSEIFTNVASSYLNILDSKF